MDIATMVDAVCQQLATPPSYVNPMGASISPSVGTTRYSRMYCKHILTYGG